MRKLGNREKDILNWLGAKPTINSGAIFDDADGIRKLIYPVGFYAWDKLIIEVKATEKISYSVTDRLLEKVNKQATQLQGIPIIAVGTKRNSFVIVRTSDFTDLMDWTQKEKRR